MDFLRTFRQETTIFLVFFSIALLIVILHLLFHPVRVLGMDTSIFYMDEKYTLAAFFTCLVAFLVGYIALTNIPQNQQKLKRIVDIGYGLFFIFLAFDEYFEIHEYTNTVIKLSLEEEEVLQTLAYQSWVFSLFLVVVAVFVLLIAKTRWADKKIRRLFSLGSLCFVGVLIFEVLGSATYGHDIYVYFVALEEGLEMIGVSFFLLATLIERKTTATIPRL